jgi:hypothetical protein
MDLNLIGTSSNLRRQRDNGVAALLLLLALAQNALKSAQAREKRCAAFAGSVLALDRAGSVSQDSAARAFVEHNCVAFFC